MPLILPDQLPAIDILKRENIFVINESVAIHQDIRPLKIIILNLMPLKIDTETDLIRLLSNTPLQIEIDLLQIEGHVPKNTPKEHLDMFYHSFSSIKENRYDGMIITGAPVEHLPFGEVTYWDELCRIFDWAEHHVTAKLFICWASQAALFHHYKIQKYPLAGKIFGIFSHDVKDCSLPLFRGFDDQFMAPHSRHTTLDAQDFVNHPEIEILSTSEEAGIYIAMAKNGKQIFITGHPEYSRDTLDREYKRDLAKNLPIEMPQNYYPDGNSNEQPVMSWRSHANLLFLNWLNYYVYQETPYNLKEIR